ncbi:STAS domain-containing protein [Candidatus Poribacteria bacterium]|nr:STAS domain-containing protein [Candidatus Poribacteria bacterium]
MEVNVEHKNGVIILKPSGRIVHDAGQKLKKVVESQLQYTKPSPNFLLDLADVTLIDSSGLGTLIALHLAIAPNHGRIGVINLNKTIKKILQTSKLITIWQHFDNKNQAISELQR